MKHVLLSLTLLCFATLGAKCQNCIAAELSPGNRVSGSPELALWYEFTVVEGDLVRDLSGKRHHGKFVGGEIVPGRRKMAMSFNEHGRIVVTPIPRTLDPAGRPFMIGAWCKATTRDGVVVAMGDKMNGFSLHMQSGIPHFSVRVDGKLFSVAAREPVPLDTWVHLIGGIDYRRSVTLLVNAWPVAKTDGRFLAHVQSESFSVANDDGTAVGDYVAPMQWQGQIEDLRLYWGFLTREDNLNEMKDWINLAGCGGGS